MQNQKSKIKNQSGSIKLKVGSPAGEHRNFDFYILHFNFSGGFTLLEMIISMGIFSVLVVASIGIMIGVSNAQLKAANVQITQDNIRFSMELMTKELRTGSRYELSTSCARRSGEGISFLTAAGERRVYYLQRTAAGDPVTIMRVVRTTECRLAKPLLAEDVSVERLRFVIGGQNPGPADGQPWVTVSLAVRSLGPKQALESRMELQTTVVQRLRDL